MKVHHGYIPIWEDSLVEARDKFIKLFVELTESPDREGIYAFVFCRYSEFQLITDVIYSVVYDSTALFFSGVTSSLVLDLDDKLNIIKTANVIEYEKTIMSVLFDSPNIEYLGEFPGINGLMYDAFTLKEEASLEVGKNLFENIYKNHIICIDKILVPEEDIADITIDYLKLRKEKFEEIVDKSIISDEEDPRLVENPLAYRFYDKDDLPQVVTIPQKIGDENV
jgi:hypothetical protein